MNTVIVALTVPAPPPSRGNVGGVGQGRRRFYVLLRRRCAHGLCRPRDRHPAPPAIVEALAASSQCSIAPTDCRALYERIVPDVPVVLAAPARTPPRGGAGVVGDVHRRGHDLQACDERHAYAAFIVIAVRHLRRLRGALTSSRRSSIVADACIVIVVTVRPPPRGSAAVVEQRPSSRPRFPRRPGAPREPASLPSSPSPPRRLAVPVPPPPRGIAGAVGAANHRVHVHHVGIVRLVFAAHVTFTAPRLRRLMEALPSSVTVSIAINACAVVAATAPRRLAASWGRWRRQAGGSSSPPSQRRWRAPRRARHPGGLAPRHPVRDPCAADATLDDRRGRG